jgi:thiopeptide-type bacteriocin biosynthesis protein
VRVRYTDAVRAVRDLAAAPLRFDVLAGRLAALFGRADESAARHMLGELVRQGVLVTCLRAPCTVVDPLGHLVERLDQADAGCLPSVAPELWGLRAVQAEVNGHNRRAPTGSAQARARDGLTRLMRQISSAGRTPLAVDLLLDREVTIPEDILCELERAAGALLRLTRHPAGLPAWREYHAAFCDRYGTGMLVPLTEVVNPDSGLGYPAGYHGSVRPAPTDSLTRRDERRLALAWEAVACQDREIVLTDDLIASVAGDEQLTERSPIPPHIELAARIHATSQQALDRGELTLTVAPARAGGVLTSRFTLTTTGSGLEEVYRALPVGVDGGLAVQMSFPPAYPHAENICRVPRYLPIVLSLGEHRSGVDEEATIPVGDLAVMATHDQLYLVSLSRQRVAEPQVFHALALDKQAPPLARFLAHLPRAFTAAWTVLDWGPAADRLPYLPRVRYRRSILAPARWRLSTDDLPCARADLPEWRQALARWRERWACPDTVDLREDDRTLRLDLDQPLHAAILHAHLARHGHAILTESPQGFGWLDGYAHEIAVPLVTTRPPQPCPLVGPLPVLTNRDHGRVPGQAGAEWLYVKIYAHPERHDEIIAEHLRGLCRALGQDAAYWFVRYRSAQETDHLRLRIRLPAPGQYGGYAEAVGDWATRLRCANLAGRLVLDTYYPEVGRYGAGPAMAAAEDVFVADSYAVATALRSLPAGQVHPIALAALSMVSIVRGFLEPDCATQWLISRPAPTSSTPANRTVATQAVRLASSNAQPGWSLELTRAWQARDTALAAYRAALPTDADIDGIAESMLHMHHNRALGINPDTERSVRRLARQAAFACHTGGDR